MAYKLLSRCLKFSFLLLSFCLNVNSIAQKNNFDKVDIWLNENLKELGGRAILQVYKDGQIIYSRAENNLSQKQKMIGKFLAKKQGKDPSEMMKDFTPATRELIASSSKWLSAALIMTFVDEGKLTLEDSIGKYLPVMTKNGKGNIKIWQCMAHLSGMQSPEIKEEIAQFKGLNSMDEAVSKIAEYPMEGEPGKVFHYSGTGLMIVGDIIEKISGKDFETLFAERIARLCKMTNTDFGKEKFAKPAGSGRSTAEDYMKFLTMILQDGKYENKTVLNKKSIIAMQQNYSKNATVAYSPTEAGAWGYGLGEWIVADGSVRAKVVSSPGLFGSFPWVDNDKKYAAFLLCLNLKRNGRNDKYIELKGLVDEAFQ